MFPDSYKTLNSRPLPIKIWQKYFLEIKSVKKKYQGIKKYIRPYYYYFEIVPFGIDLNFAPVLDIDESKSSIIGDRAFSKNVKEVIEFSSLYIGGMHEAGMKSTGKHFPGHGGVYEDSHLELVEDQRSLEDLLHEDIKPYSELKDKLDVIMCSHVSYPL